MDSHLKNCPFCLSNDVDPEGGLSQDQDGVRRHFPVCNECEASCESVERWNTRPAPVVAESAIPEAGRGFGDWWMSDLNKPEKHTSRGWAKAAWDYQQKRIEELESQLSTANAALLQAQAENAVMRKAIEKETSAYHGVVNGIAELFGSKLRNIEHLQNTLNGTASRAMIEEMERLRNQIVALKAILQPMRDQIIHGNEKIMRQWDEALNPQKKDG